jgi:hypothetical protein
MDTPTTKYLGQDGKSRLIRVLYSHYKGKFLVTTNFGFLELLLYLKQRKVRSYYGFLNQHRNIIVASLTSFNTTWDELNNTWTNRFVKESERVLDNTSHSKLKNKVCCLFCKLRATPGRLRLTLGELPDLTAWYPLQVLNSGALNLLLVKVF